MISLQWSSNRWFSIILIMAFMLLATPTPSLEITSAESMHRPVSQGLEYSPNMSVRKHTSLSESKRFAACFLFALFILSIMLNASVRALPAAHVSFRPQIARRLTRLLLSPIKFTSIYV